MRTWHVVPRDINDASRGRREGSERVRKEVEMVGTTAGTLVNDL